MAAKPRVGGHLGDFVDLGDAAQRSQVGVAPRHSTDIVSLLVRMPNAKDAPCRVSACALQVTGAAISTITVLAGASLVGSSPGVSSSASA